MTTFCIGDVHGCSSELADLLDKIALTSSDRVLFIGDLIDKGPDPIGTVRLARSVPNSALVQGNHEEKALRFRKHEAKAKANPKYKNPMEPPKSKRYAEWMGLSDEDLAYLSAAPIVLRPIPGWIAVHGGVLPGEVPAEKQKPGEVLRLRWVTAEGKYVALKPGETTRPEGALDWSAQWDGPDSIVYGHEVHDEVSPRVDRNARGAECWGIDTGCVHGGRLTALALETREIVQVQARRQYTPRGFVSED
jgi:hypothetical protein